MQIRLRFTALILSLLMAMQAAAEPTPATVRVVSLAPSITEIIGAIGGEANLAGRTSFCNYPPEIVKDVTIVGGFGLPSVEALLSINPDLILDIDLEDESIVNQLAELGLKRHRITCKKLDDIPPAIEEIGRLISRETQANALATQMREQIDAARQMTTAVTNRPRVFLQIWNDPVMTATPSSFISELLYLAGGENICTNGVSDFIKVSSEWVVGTDPDIILCLEGDGTADSRHLVMNRPGWDSITAVKNGRVYDHFNMDVLTRPGPRVLEGVTLIRDCLTGARPSEVTATPTPSL